MVDQIDYLYFKFDSQSTFKYSIVSRLKTGRALFNR